MNKRNPLTFLGMLMLSMALIVMPVNGLASSAGGGC